MRLTAERRKELEQIRLIAFEKLSNGISQAQVAREHGVTRTTASRWAKAVRNGRSAAATKTTGRPCFIDRERCKQLIARFIEINNRITCQEIAEKIFEQAGVSYDRDHVSRLVRKFGFRKK
jgi:transposase